MSNSASSDNNMRHMNFIDGVAAEDCAVLRVKEFTYMGSWKRAGGRSAWFMARRNMDRLLQMMAPPKSPEGYDLEETVCGVQNSASHRSPQSLLREETVRGVEHMRDLVRAEDVFAKIEEHPGGEDGTVLACLRDLRRYLVLVEAEMQARGVVHIDTVKASHLNGLEQTTVSESNPELTGYYQGPTTVIIPPGYSANVYVFSKPVTDPAQASERRVPRFENEVHFSKSEALRRHEIEANASESNASESNRPGTPEHGSTTPWVCDEASLMEVKLSNELVGKFWNKRARDVYTLEPHVSNHSIPRMLRDVYNMRGESWTLRMDRVPLEVRDYFPELPLEQNMKEWEELPEWQRVLYTWVDDQSKYRLAVENHAWHVEKES